MNSIAINTSQNVNLDFEVASIAERMFAFAIDMVIKVAYAIILWLLLDKVLHFGALHSWDNWSVAAFLGIIMLPIVLYTLIFETLMEGQTPGKTLRQIKVVKIDGYQAHFSDYLMRWFFRLVDVWISTGVIGILSILFGKNNQRLGGLVSGTAVISTKRRVNIDHTILTEISESYVPKFQQVLALSDDDMRIIKDNYRIAVLKREYEVIDKLADKIRLATGIPDQRPALHNMEFIDRVIKDFNYYTADK